MTPTITPPVATAEQREHWLKLIRQFNTVMMVTHAEDDRLRARPMGIAQVEDGGRLWFITAMETAKTHEIEEDTRVQIVCQDDYSLYLSVGGRAALVEDDRAKIHEVWKESYKVWFPEGKDDPNLILIAFYPEEVEYWDNEGWNKIEYAMETAKAYLTGTTPDAEDDDQHAYVKL